MIDSLGFFGIHCERHLCSRSYCNDHGQCFIDRLETELQMGPGFINENIQFRCECDSNFTGERCNIFTSSINSTMTFNNLPSQLPLAKSCKDLNCSNGGTCHQSSLHHHPTCICAYGYTGFNCKIATMNRIDNSKTIETKSSSHPSQPNVNNSTINTETRYDMIAYTAMIVIAIVIFGLFVLRLQNSVLKKMQRLVLI